MMRSLCDCSRQHSMIGWNKLDAPADAIWTPSPAFRLLLEDCCRAYAGEEPMILDEDEIIKTRVCGKELVLKKGYEIKTASLS